MNRPKYYRDAILGYLAGTHSKEDVFKACYRFYPGIAAWWSYRRFHRRQHSLELDDLVQVAVLETSCRLGIHGDDPSKRYDPDHPGSAEADDYCCRYASWAIQRAIEKELHFDRRHRDPVEFVPDLRLTLPAFYDTRGELFSGLVDDDSFGPARMETRHAMARRPFLPDDSLDRALEAIGAIVGDPVERAALETVFRDLALGISIDEILEIASGETSRYGIRGKQLENLIQYASRNSRRFWRIRARDSGQPMPEEIMAGCLVSGTVSC